MRARLACVSIRYGLHLYWVNSFNAQFFISISCRNLQYSSASASKSLPKISKEASFNSTDCFSALHAFSLDSSFSLKMRSDELVRFGQRDQSECSSNRRILVLPYFSVSRYRVGRVCIQLNFHHLRPLKMNMRNRNVCIVNASHF